MRTGAHTRVQYRASCVITRAGQVLSTQSYYQTGTGDECHGKSKLAQKGTALRSINAPRIRIHLISAPGCKPWLQSVLPGFLLQRGVSFEAEFRLVSPDPDTRPSLHCLRYLLPLRPMFLLDQTRFQSTMSANSNESDYQRNRIRTYSRTQRKPSSKPAPAKLA